MSFEIERKFLVKDDFWKSLPAIYFCQGYLCRDPNRTVRIRIANNAARITIKGAIVQGVRYEFEYDIPIEDANILLDMCDKPLIEKNRRLLAVGDHCWEIDEFLGDNLGLVVAEIELQSNDQEFEIPDWVGPEVTHDLRYQNSNLVHNPFSAWPEQR